MIRHLVGDCRVHLATLPAESVQCVITSPPYYGLRDYGTEPLVWAGDAEHAHIFGAAIPGDNRGGSGTFNGRNGRGEDYGRDAARGSFCPCGAWLGSLGLEPTPELCIEHLVEVFREVRRVLRKDGALWVNLGDSYAGSGKGPSNSLNKGNPHAHDAGVAMRGMNRLQDTPAQWLSTPAGLKAKDLMLMPARMAQALQADGWYLRSQIPWLKRNSMPESVTDRPATAVEYVYLLAKSKSYYWDADAVRVDNAAGSFRRYKPGEAIPTFSKQGGSARANNSFKAGQVFDTNGRNRRNSDWFFESWQGLLLDEQDDPLALVVNPAPFKGAHFATFPPKLVEPMIRASTSEKGQCPECGAPWVRATERTEPTYWEQRKRHDFNGRKDDPSPTGNHLSVSRGRPDNSGVGYSSSVTTGWRPSCAHTTEPVPQTVLDPFAGAGTVGLVADRLNRNAILIDLKPDYGDMTATRLIDDSPLFVEFESTA